MQDGRGLAAAYDPELTTMTLYVHGDEQPEDFPKGVRRFGTGLCRCNVA
ncbi:hypothetical protein ACFHW1_28460 [Micromonospora sp. LOL_014]